jgi:hypothetical protein
MPLRDSVPPVAQVPIAHPRVGDVLSPAEYAPGPAVFSILRDGIFCVSAV